LSRTWVLALASGALLLVAALPSLPPGVRNWDNQVKLQLARNLLRGEGLVFTEPTPDDRTYVVASRDGRRTSAYPPGAPALQLVTLGGVRLGLPLSEGLPSLALLAVLAAVLVALGRRAGASPGAAAAGAVLACAGTGLWPMAAHGYDVLAEAVALAGILWAGTGSPNVLRWAGAGMLLGAAFATRLGAAVLAVPAAVLVVLQRPVSSGAALRRGLALALGCAPGVGAVLWSNAVRFGSPLTPYLPATGGAPAELVVPWLSIHHLEGMAGLVLSPGKGLFWYAPPLLGLAAAAPWLRRRAPALALALAAYLAAAVVVYGRLVFWHAEWCWGPRYVAPLFVAAAPVAWFAAERLGTRPGRVAGLAALTLAIALQAIPVVAYPVEAHFGTTLPALEAQGRLATRPITRPPIPADNRVLYFEPGNAMYVSIGRAVATGMYPPRALARRFALALIVPLAALLLVLLAARAVPEEASPAASSGEPTRAVL